MAIGALAGVGAAITATNTLVDPDGLGTLHYQWKSGTDNVGTDSDTYTPLVGDLGKTISVVVTYTDGNGTLETITSNSSTILNGFTANKAGFKTNLTADSVEGSVLSTGDDILSATAAQVSDAGTNIDGLAGNDVFNITGTGNVDLTGIAGFANIETISFLGTGNTLVINASDIGTGKVTTINGGHGYFVVDVKHDGGNADLTDLTYNYGNNLLFDGNGDLTLDENVIGTDRAFRFSDDDGDLVLKTNGSGIFDFSGGMTIEFASGAGTSELNLDSADDTAKTVLLVQRDVVNLDKIIGETTGGVVTTLSLKNTFTLSQVEVTNIDVLKFDGDTTVRADAFTTSNFTTLIGDNARLYTFGNDDVDLTNTEISGITQIEFYLPGTDNTIKLDKDSIAGDIFLISSSSDNLEITEAGDYTNLRTNYFDSLVLSQTTGAVIFDSTMFGVFTRMINIDGVAAGGAESLTINMDHTEVSFGVVDLGATQDVAVIINDTAGDDIITAFKTSSAGSTTVINLANGGNDIVKQKNQVITASADDYVTINNFTVGGDELRISTGSGTHGTTYQTLTTGALGGTAISVVANSVIEIEGSGAIALTDIVDGGGIETIIATEIADTDTLLDDGDDLTFIVYDNAGNVGIYNADITNANADLTTGDFEIELVAILNSVAVNALSSVDFV